MISWILCDFWHNLRNLHIINQKPSGKILWGDQLPVRGDLDTSGQLFTIQSGDNQQSLMILYLLIKHSDSTCYCVLFCLTCRLCVIMDCVLLKRSKFPQRAFFHKVKAEGGNWRQCCRMFFFFFWKERHYITNAEQKQC